MHRSLLKAAVCGGIIAFVWCWLSWTVLPIHNCCIHSFTHPGKVASVVKDNAPASGMYVLPYTFGYNENSSHEDMKRAIAMMDNGPFMFAAVLPNGMQHTHKQAMAIGLIIDIIGAFLAAWLLSHAQGLAFRQKVLFVALFGLAVGVLTYLPAWNWIGFPGNFVLTQIFDMVIAWTLAGLAMAKIVKKIR